VPVWESVAVQAGRDPKSQFLNPKPEILNYKPKPLTPNLELYTLNP